MPADNSYKFDSEAPLDIGFPAHEFGILFPSDSGFSMRTQTDGVMCHQLRFSGQFLPLGRPKVYRGFPDWLPDNDGGVAEDETHPVATVDLDTIPDHDYETLPEWVQDRGHFYNWTEFSNWLDQDNVWRHSWADLVEELRQWNYCPDGSMPHAPDMTERWDNLDEIWAAIDNCLNFTYDVYDYHKHKLNSIQNDTEFNPPFDTDTYPSPTEGIRWITLTGSKTNSRGDPTAPWADTLEGETVLQLYPNSD